MMKIWLGDVSGILSITFIDSNLIYNFIFRNNSWENLSKLVGELRNVKGRGHVRIGRKIIEDIAIKIGGNGIDGAKILQNVRFKIMSE